MPYIKEKDRERYDSLVDTLVSALLSAMTENSEEGDRLLNVNVIKGHHNYIMYSLALKLVKKLGVRYHTLQDIIGTFDCSKLEFYRRIIAPYEDAAIKKNGDVE